MPTKEDQYKPSKEELSLFSKKVLAPKLSSLSKELGQKLECSIISVFQGKEEELLKNENSNGICKVCFNKTFKPERQIVYTAVRFENLQNSSGFTGFNLNTQIKSGEPLSRGYVVIYNDLGFPKW